jgi:hypothetical protein
MSARELLGLGIAAMLGAWTANWAAAGECEATWTLTKLSDQTHTLCDAPVGACAIEWPEQTTLVEDGGTLVLTAGGDQWDLVPQ